MRFFKWLFERQEEVNATVKYEELYDGNGNLVKFNQEARREERERLRSGPEAKQFIWDILGTLKEMKIDEDLLYIIHKEIITGEIYKKFELHGVRECDKLRALTGIYNFYRVRQKKIKVK